MKVFTLPSTIELDGTVELLRCPDFVRGWSPGEIRTSYNAARWSLPPSFDHVREEWNRRHPDERSDAKVAVREFHLDENQGLACQLQQTEWREVRPLHERPRADGGTALRRTGRGCEFILPNIGVVHVIATTKDGWILAIRRSDSVHYHPGAWTLTYEEGLAPEDVEADAVFQQAARRGLMEELTEQARLVSLEAFRVVSIVLEEPLGNPAVVMFVELPLSRSDIGGRLPSDELNEDSLTMIPIDQSHLQDLLTGATPLSSKRPGGWHPTARYRLLAAVAHFFGEEAAARVLARVQAVRGKPQPG